MKIKDVTHAALHEILERDSGLASCASMINISTSELSCTRDKGHKGAHVATGPRDDEIYAIWQ